MDVFAGVILHMDTGDADLLRAVLGFDFQPAVLADGQVELGNLVAGREIRIEVVLAGENGALVDVAVRGQTHQGGVMHGLGIDPGQGPGHAGTDLAGIGVRRLAESIRTGAEQLGLGRKLNMHLEADDGFIIRHDPKLLGSGFVSRTVKVNAPGTAEAAPA